MLLFHHSWIGQLFICLRKTSLEHLSDASGSSLASEFTLRIWFLMVELRMDGESSPISQPEIRGFSLFIKKNTQNHSFKLVYR